MRLKITILFVLLGLIGGCATQEPSNAFFKSANIDTFAQFQASVQPGSDGVVSTFSTSGESKFYGECIGTENARYPVEVRGKCYYSNCYRVQNSEKCEQVGADVKQKIELVRAEDEKELLREQEKTRNEKQKRCYSGDLQTCIKWIHFEDINTYDVLRKMCASNKIFKCTTKFEKPNVEKFDIKCNLVDSKKISCEEIYNQKFASTVVTFLK